MEDSLLKENLCRICLKEKGILNWNEEVIEFCGISYKDCYEKYIGVQAKDTFPQSLCEICSNGFKNAHLLFERALKSLTILESIHSTEGSKFQNQVKVHTDIVVMDIEEEMYPTFTDDNESLVLAENYTNSIKKEISSSDDMAIEKVHFIEIKRCESSSDDLLEPEVKKNSDTKSSTKQGRGSKKYLCAYCPLKVNDSFVLKNHEATHNENRERKFTCTKCGVKLYTKMSLRTHMEIHAENREKRFKCEFCDKAFFNRGACNVHRRIHLGQMVTCPICSKEFVRQVDLDRHLPKHSVAPLKKNVEQIKHTIQCQSCNKTVATTKWKEHRAIHLNQPAMKCKICEKDFYCRKKCVRHLNRVHHKTKDEYDKFIYCYVDCTNRLSHLMIKQQNDAIQSISKKNLSS